MSSSPILPRQREQPLAEREPVARASWLPLVCAAALVGTCLLLLLVSA